MAGREKFRLSFLPRLEGVPLDKLTSSEGLSVNFLSDVDDSLNSFDRWLDDISDNAQREAFNNLLIPLFPRDFSLEENGQISFPPALLFLESAASFSQLCLNKYLQNYRQGNPDLYLSKTNCFASCYMLDFIREIGLNGIEEMEQKRDFRPLNSRLLRVYSAETIVPEAEKKVFYTPLTGQLDYRITFRENVGNLKLVKPLPLVAAFSLKRGNFGGNFSLESSFTLFQQIFKPLKNQRWEEMTENTFGNEKQRTILAATDSLSISNQLREKIIRGLNLSSIMN